MPPITYTINGGTAVFCALNECYDNSFNKNPDANTVIYTEVRTDEFTQSINFTSNETSYDSMHLICSETDTTKRKMYYVSNGVETLVYDNRVWTNDAYKIVIFETQSVRERIYALLTIDTHGNSCGYSLKSGTYKWNSFSTALSYSLSMSTSGFISNGNRYGSISILPDATKTSIDAIEYFLMPTGGKYTYISVYNNSVWTDESYKIISIPENSYISYNGRDKFLEYYSAFTPVNVDLTTLSGYSQLVAGTQYTITVKAMAMGYQDSDPSEPVSYTVPESTKTLEAGTYKWVDALKNYATGALSRGTSYSFDLLFTSNGINYDSIMYFWTDEGGSYMVNMSYNAQSSGVDVYSENFEGTSPKWNKVNSAYQTITLSTPQTVSAEFYEWAITGGNLVKQEGETWVLDQEPSITARRMSYQGSFLSDGKTYTSISVEYDDFEYISYGDDQVYYGNGEWSKEEYRTVTFYETPTGNFLIWLQANATKQSGGGY